ncbi:6577_t:CDS:2, partial [Acaulospora colombiana]
MDTKEYTSAGPVPGGGAILSPLQIIDSLEQTTEKAKNTGDLLTYDSQVFTVEEHGVQYEVRLCPALQKKEEARVPKSNIAPDPDHVSKVVETIFHKDPFLPPFNSLLVGEMKDDLEESGIGYYTLLNKYAVVPVYESQAQPLTPSQLVHAYLLLLAAKARSKQYFAFFNCGVL